MEMLLKTACIAKIRKEVSMATGLALIPQGKHPDDVIERNFVDQNT